MSCLTLEACVRVLNFNNTFVDIKQRSVIALVRILIIILFFFWCLRFQNLVIGLWHFFTFTFIPLFLQIRLSNVRFSLRLRILFIKISNLIESLIWTWPRTCWCCFLWNNFSYSLALKLTCQLSFNWGFSILNHLKSLLNILVLRLSFYHWRRLSYRVWLFSFTRTLRFSFFVCWGKSRVLFF